MDYPCRRFWNRQHYAVSVRERTNEIASKALVQKLVVLIQFLTESIVLCLLGELPDCLFISVLAVKSLDRHFLATRNTL